MIVAALAYVVGGPIAAGGAFLVGIVLISVAGLRDDDGASSVPGLFSLDLESHILPIDASRRLAIKEELGSLHQEGEQVYHLNEQGAAQEWVTKVHNKIESVFGVGEAKLFLSDSGYTFYSASGKVKNWVDGRLRRLANLIERADSLTNI